MAEQAIQTNSNIIYSFKACVFASEVEEQIYCSKMNLLTEWVQLLHC